MLVVGVVSEVPGGGGGGVVWIEWGMEDEVRTYYGKNRPRARFRLVTKVACQD